jgi:hypothetical protein
MSTRPQLAQPEPTHDQPTTEPTSSHATASEHAPATFSRTRTDRLQNLIDEWNTAFAADGSKTN